MVTFAPAGHDSDVERSKVPQEVLALKFLTWVSERNMKNAN
jgi:hypothetical protein